MDAHGVVERHDAERPVARVQPVLERLREPTRALGSMGARDAFRPSGRPRGVELDRRLVLVQVERAGMLVLRRELRDLAGLAQHDLGARVLDAVGEVGLGDTV